MKILSAIFLFTLAVVTSRASILYQDSANYPYTNGCIEGQGQWYCYTPATPARDAMVTNNVLYFTVTNTDSVAVPTNGFTNVLNGTITYASFTVNVSQLPATANGGYFCELMDSSNNNVCHIFIDTRDTVVPGTYRLGVANFSTSFSSLVPPVNYPLDLATGITYTVVCAFDTAVGSPTEGATLWINPSIVDYFNVLNGDNTSTPGVGTGFVFGTDTTTVASLLNINVSRIGLSPYISAGISNLIIGTDFTDVNTTNLPVIGIQPQSGTNYSGNSTTFYAAASGVDLTYQWYSVGSGALVDDGVNIIGATSNILFLNNLSISDSYYLVVSDVYGNQVTSVTAVDTVITTPTAVFFPTNVVAVNLTNNLFTGTGFTNIALGTGPISYQWYFAPTNTPNTYTAMSGQTSAALSLNLSDYSFAGNYYVVAYNAINGGSTAYGPTNSLLEIAPLVATLQQVHNFLLATTNQLYANKTGSYYINSNNVVVGGYVTTSFGFGSTYTEFFIQDATGYGTEVYLGGLGNTNTPPIGSYVTITGPLYAYNTALEITPKTQSAIVTSTAPVIVVGPKLANNMFNDLATNGLGLNGIMYGGSLVTFTNVYIYSSKTGAAIGANGSHSGVGGVFASNSYTALYFTIGGPYNAVSNTNMIEIYQFGYTNNPYVLNPFYGKTIPTFCYQITGVLSSYQGASEILPSRYEDYVATPPTVAATLTRGKFNATTIQLTPQVGATYSVYGATNLTGPWTQKVTGLAYYPTNGTFTETNTSKVGFYRITTP